MKASFNDTEKFILANFAHTESTEKAFNPVYRIDADKTQIETLTAKSFNSDGELRTNHLIFIDNGKSISFFRLFLECFERCKCGNPNCANNI